MRKRFDWEKLYSIMVIFVVIVLPILILCGFIATEIYVCVTYGNLPVSDIPTWALIFMFGRR